MRLSVLRLRGAIRMQVRDNGKSFEVQRVFSARTKRHLGLIGMRERVEMGGGSLTVESAPGKGTTIRVRIPLGNGNGV